MIPLALVPIVVRRWLCAAHLALIAALSLLPAWIFPPSAAGLPGIDKVAHLAMYGVLGAMSRWAAGEAAIPAAARWLLPAAGVGYGVLMELLQGWIAGAGRSFSWGDVLANLAGVVAGWIVAERRAARAGRGSA